MDIDLDKIVARFVSIFQKMDEEGLKRAVHQLCLTLIPHERRQIVQEVADLFERLRDTLQKEYADINLQRIESTTANQYEYSSGGAAVSTYADASTV